MAELEAKFLVRRPGQVDDLLVKLESLGYSCSEAAPRSHVDIYYDTEDFSILGAGWTLRCRDSGGRRVANLKACGTRRGDVFEREEIEQPLPGGEDMGDLPPGPVQALLTEVAAGMPRHELFRVSTRRRVIDIVGSDARGAKLELDVDCTRITADGVDVKAGAELEFEELEVELKAGDEDDIVRIASVLRDDDGFVAARFSKFDRGMRVAGLSPDALGGDAGQPTFSEDDAFLDLLYSYLRRQFRKLIAHEPVAREGLDPEGVHKMRVGIRRIRAMLRMYGDVLVPDLGKKLDRKLRALAKRLGRARDADVGEMEMLSVIASLPEQVARAAAPYIEHLRDETFDAYSELDALFDSRKYRKLINKVDSLLSAGPGEETRNARGALTIAEAADRDISAKAERMLSRGDGIDAGTKAKKIHKLRIDAKRVRYLLDMFAKAEPERWRATIEALEELQELLGTHQDAITAHARLEQFAASLPDDGDEQHLEASLAQLMQSQDDRVIACRGEFPSYWLDFRRAFNKAIADHSTER